MHLMKAQSLQEGEEILKAMKQKKMPDYARNA